MDFKKFGIVIAMLGLLIAGYGGVQLAMNLPVQARQSGNFFEDFEGRLEADYKNYTRERRRGSATKVLLAGGVIFFLGLGMMASAKDSSLPT